ncbi:MAG: hypothetical protein JNN30_11865 [Rhodanobacteraceae bacterium]|nr:hypothetical protein [Rhodanobacteraceae bacterium]
MKNEVKPVAVHRVAAGALAFALAGFGGASQANRADLDLAFGVDGVVRLSVTNGGFNDLAVQPDGKIVAIGMSGSDWLIARFNQDGSLDTGFGNAGVSRVTPPPTATPPLAKAVVLDASGRLLVAGGRYVMRLESNGSLDASYGSGGIYTPPLNPVPSLTPQQLDLDISDMTASASGGFLLSCTVNGIVFPSYISKDVSALKLTATGVADTSFGTNGFATKFGDNSRIYNATYAVAERGGAVYVGGRSATRQQFSMSEIVRFTATGQVDTTFGSNGVLGPVFPAPAQSGTTVGKLALQSGGLIAAGFGYVGSLEAATLALRVNSAGQIDATFPMASFTPASTSPVWALFADADDRILLGTTTTNAIVASLQPNGAADSGFGAGGRREVPFDGQPATVITAQPDGKYLLAGGVGSSVAYVARLRGTAAIPPEVVTTPVAGTTLAAAGGGAGTTQSLGTVRFSNRGGDALTVTGCAASSGFSVAAAFPLTIAQGASQDVAVSCRLPSTPLTTITGTLTCATNDSDEPQISFPLQCTSGAGAPGAAAIPALSQVVQWLLGVLVALIAGFAIRRVRPV